MPFKFVLVAAEIVRGIAHAVVGQRMPVVARHLIAPAAVCIAVGDRLRRRAKRAGRVGVDLLVQNVPPLIVFIRDRLVGDAVVLARQSVDIVVLVGNTCAALRDCSDVPVVVIGIDILVVVAVLVLPDQRGCTDLGS